MCSRPNFSNFLAFEVTVQVEAVVPFDCQPFPSMPRTEMGKNTIVMEYLEMYPASPSLRGVRWLVMNWLNQKMRICYHAHVEKRSRMIR